MKDRLTLVDSIIMYCFEDKEPQIDMPQCLWKKIIENLHATNQYIISILARDWQRLSNKPLITAPFPEYPFQNGVANLFEIDHHIYLAYADRLAEFIELAFFPTTPNSNFFIGGE